MKHCYCPKCETDVSDSYEPADFSVGINGGWYCEACDLALGDDGHYEPMEGDVGIPPAPKSPDHKYGIPSSELSSRPGPKDDIGHPDHVRYENWKRLAKSWGYD